MNGVYSRLQKTFWQVENAIAREIVEGRGYVKG
jgi:hypothetical protein